MCILTSGDHKLSKVVSVFYLLNKCVALAEDWVLLSGPLLSEDHKEGGSTKHFWRIFFLSLGERGNMLKMNNIIQLIIFSLLCTHLYSSLIFLLLTCISWTWKFLWALISLCVFCHTQCFQGSSPLSTEGADSVTNSVNMKKNYNPESSQRSNYIRL